MLCAGFGKRWTRHREITLFIDARKHISVLISSATNHGRRAYSALRNQLSVLRIRVHADIYAIMVNDCDFEHDGDCGVCVRCGFTICGHSPPIRRRCDVQPPPGLGDMVAAGLTAVGITKERVSAAIGGPCGCDKRQAALNDIGRKFGIG